MHSSIFKFALALCILAPASALGADVQSAVYDADSVELILTGSGLSAIDDVTLTDEEGKETSVSFSFTGNRNEGIVATIDGSRGTERFRYVAPGTYRLRLYTNSVLQDEMDVAIPSIAGSVSRGAIVKRERAMRCFAAKCTIAVRCPSGYRAISGGFRKLSNNFRLLDITASGPLGADRWAVDVRKVDIKTWAVDAAASVICLWAGSAASAK